MKALVAWRGRLFLTEGKIGVLSVKIDSILTRVGVYVGVCVYTHTHAHTAIRIFVQSTNMYIYAKRRDEILD